MKISFRDDYSEGAHSKIIEALGKDNLIQQAGYGLDLYSNNARKLIHEHLQNPESAIHFVGGGTQANLLVISALLRPYEAVIAVDTGHINVHETGAIEAVGHKVITCPHVQGKLLPSEIKKVMESHLDEHKVKPKMVYISNATEWGTVYTLEEIEEIHTICEKYDLHFFMDGARLGVALNAENKGLSLAYLSKLVDVFYLGGTKNGALFGEAIVINNPHLQNDFRYILKQKGALMAKGRALGLQFEALFTDNLFFEMAQHANDMARLMTEKIIAKNIPLQVPTQSNQVFPVLPLRTIEELQKDYIFHVWEKLDNESAVIRLVTSWATEKEKVLEFCERL